MSPFETHRNGIHYEETGTRITREGTKEVRIRNLGAIEIAVVRAGEIKQRLPQFWEGWLPEPFRLMREAEDGAT